MSHPDTPGTIRRRRNVLVFAAAAVVLVAVILLVMSVTSGFSVGGGQQTVPKTTAASTAASNSSTAIASTTAVPSTAVPSASALVPPTLTVPLPPAEAEAVDLNVKDFVAAGAEALTHTDVPPSASDFTELATGSALDSMVADSEDFVNNGWHQEGTPTVDSITVVNYQPSSTPPEATLNVCIDSSKVNVLTADGSLVREGTSAGQRRLVHS